MTAAGRDEGPSSTLQDAMALLGSWLWMGIGAVIGYIVAERRTLGRVEEPALRALSLERNPDRPPTIGSVVALLEELEHLTGTDPVSGVRSRYRITLDMAIAGATAQTYGAWLGLCLIDIDHFKRVNDTYGHNTGDEVLTEVGRRLGAAITRDARVGRYGGEEFLAVLPRADDQDTTRAAEEFRRAIESEPIKLKDGTSIEVTVSVGAVASYGPHAQVERLATGADHAMYEAKDLGRNRVVFHHLPT